MLSIDHILQKNTSNKTINDTHDQTWFLTTLVYSAYLDMVLVVEQETHVRRFYVNLGLDLRGSV